MSQYRWCCTVLTVTAKSTQVSQDGLVTCELVAGAVASRSPTGEDGGASGVSTNGGATRVSNMMMHVSLRLQTAAADVHTLHRARERKKAHLTMTVIVGL